MQKQAEHKQIIFLHEPLGSRGWSQSLCKHVSTQYAENILRFNILMG